MDNKLTTLINIKKMQSIIKHYFSDNYKLFSLSKKIVDQYHITYDNSIVHMFNNKTWLDIWSGFNSNHISITIESDYFSLFDFFDIYNRDYHKDINKLDFIYHFTGLLYLITITELINEDGNFTILDFLDPKNGSDEYINLRSEVKYFFPPLIEKYSKHQLYLISILFIHLSKKEYLKISSLGKKYWQWIYDNTDDEIRNKILRKFENV